MIIWLTSSVFIYRLEEKIGVEKHKYYNIFRRTDRCEVFSNTDLVYLLWRSHLYRARTSDSTVLATIQQRYVTSGENKKKIMAKAASKEKDPVNFVHQNAILCETITKEQRHQKMYTNYSVNPFKKSKLKI